MSEFGWAMQSILQAKLVVENICGGRVYEDVPKIITYPYLRFSEITSNRNDATCLDYTIEQVTLHVYAKGGFSKRDAIAEAAKIIEILRNQVFDFGNDSNGFFKIIAEFGRKDIENGIYTQNLRIEAHISKQKEL